jgi:sigma-B regulation protein RsbU (phosphoserine phosphatase)
MLVPPLAHDEAERLADLRALELLDTPPEERFDRIVQLAASVFDVPIAYIALIDSDRQWFKAKCGLTADETGRDVSFCGHTILQREPLVVPDTHGDARFVDNPLVVGEPFIRFYAGHPLAGKAGTNVGTLCLADSRPRSLGPRELEAFRWLARVAEHEIGLLDLVRAQRELLDARAALAASQRRLERELADAAAFVRSVVPEPIRRPGLSSDHRLLTSSELGGDMLGALPLDAEGRLTAVYLLDVSGHGVGASLLSVAVGNVLRGRTLPGVDFTKPADVLAGLNVAFPLDRTDGKFFTAWYGVLDAADGSLTFAAAGHHPALLIPPSGPIDRLGGAGPLIGFFADATFETSRIVVAAGSVVYLFSDGGFECTDATGTILGYDAFAALLTAIARDPELAPPRPAAGRLDAITARIVARAGGRLDDDFGLLEIAVP